jgi:hypothetical protein
MQRNPVAKRLAAGFTPGEADPPSEAMRRSHYRQACTHAIEGLIDQQRLTGI